MGELDVGQAVTLSPEVVAARLRALENLVSDLDELLPRLAGTHQRQGAGMWTTIGACEAFAQTYASAIDGLRNNLLAMRGQVAAAGQSLAASAAALTSIDQDTQDRITALTSRLNTAPPAGPQVCTPYDIPAADIAPYLAPVSGLDQAPDPSTPPPTAPGAPAPDAVSSASVWGTTA